MARKPISYFSEERGRNNNPYFFKNMRDEDLRKQVKRIIRDIKYDNLVEDDYVYFKNDKIISACITESWKQYRSAQTIRNALLYYFNNAVNPNAIQTQNYIVPDEGIVVAEELGKYTNKCSLWGFAYKAFFDISNGADIRMAISNIYKLDNKLFYDL